MKKKYEELKEKYNLPDYESLVKSFEIDSIGKDDNILREILKKQHNKIEYYTAIMEGLLQPDTNLSDMKESGALSPEEFATVRILFAEGMYLLRRFTEFSLEYDDEQAAKFLVEVNKEWEKFKPNTKIILKKLKETWKKEYKSDYDKGYLG